MASTSCYTMPSVSPSTTITMDTKSITKLSSTIYESSTVTLINDAYAY